MPYRFVFLIVSMLAMTAQAGERQAHFHAERPESYAQAVTILREATQEVEKALAQNDLTEVHKQSYAMEEAIQRMQEELTHIAQEVETMHLASEKQDRQTVQQAISAFAPRVQSLHAPQR